MASECSMIRGPTIKPHYPVQILVDRRPHLAKVLAPITTKKLPEGIATFPKISWEQSKAELQELGWTLPRYSTMNPMQAYYLDKLGASEQAAELGDQYCEWSATLALENISQHHQEDKEIKKYLG